MPVTFLLITLALQSAQSTPGDTAVLRIGNRTVVAFHGRLGAATPEERAAAAVGAWTPRSPPAKIRFQPSLAQRGYSSWWGPAGLYCHPIGRRDARRRVNEGGRR